MNPLPEKPNTNSSTPTPVYPESYHADISQSGGGWRSVGSTLLLLLLAPIIAFSIAAYVVQSYQVDGESMETNLQDNDRLIVNKIPRTLAKFTHHNYLPKRGDIIVFNQTLIQDIGITGDKQLIKRVIALPGERVVVKDGEVTVYNNKNPQGFNPDKSTGYKITAANTPSSVDLVVPADNIFVLGDNRPNSEDSRYFGPVNTSKIVGKLVLRIIPLNKIQAF